MVIEWIPAGDAGTEATLRRMAQLAMTGAVSPLVRGVAARVVLGTGRDAMLHARLINDWIDTHTDFLADPSVAEALTHADDAIRVIATDGIAQIDCDDVAILAASLGMSIGLHARFVAVAFGEAYAHVWCDLGSPNGEQWFSVDPTRPVMGLPSISRTVILEVS